MDYNLGSNDEKMRCFGILHIVKKGDTLYKIAKQYNVPLSRVMYANPYVDIYNLQIGDEICVPVMRPRPPMSGNRPPMSGNRPPMWCNCPNRNDMPMTGESVEGGGVPLPWLRTDNNNSSMPQGQMDGGSSPMPMPQGRMDGNNPSMPMPQGRMDGNNSSMPMPQGRTDGGYASMPMSEGSLNGGRSSMQEGYTDGNYASMPGSCRNRMCAPEPEAAQGWAANPMTENMPDYMGSFRDGNVPDAADSASQRGMQDGMERQMRGNGPGYMDGLADRDAMGKMESLSEPVEPAASEPALERSMGTDAESQMDCALDEESMCEKAPFKGAKMS